MEYNEETVENLENLTDEQLEEQDELDSENNTHVDLEARLEAANKKAAILQRLLNKKDKPIINKQPLPSDVSKDIEEIKFYRKVDRFADENGLTKAQAEKVLKYHPDADADTLKDPFIANGLKAIAKKEKVENATPGSSRVNSINGKTFKEMTREEREANFSKMIQG